MTETASAASTGTFRSLASRNARLFFVGLLVSNVGTWLQLTATSFLLYDLTGRSTDIGVNFALQFLPMLLLGAWAGALSDRLDRLRMTITTQALQGVQALVLGALVLVGWANLPVIYVLSAFLGVVNAIDNPARRSLVTELVPQEHMSNAMALNTAVMTGSRIFGPALAAALVGPLGVGWLFVANGVSFSAMLVALLALDRRQMHVAPRRPRGGTPVRDGLRFVRSNRRLRVMFVVFAVVSTFAFNYSVSLPQLADRNWGGSEAFGWVLAMTSVGSLVGALWAARLPRASYRSVALSVVVLGVSNVGLAWSPNLLVAFAWALPLGAAGAAMIASSNAITQQEAPPEMRGRMLALTAVAFLGSTPIGSPLTGFVADNVSPEWSLGYGGIIAIVAGLVMIQRLAPRRTVGP
jgi:MFS family permease